MRFKKFSLLAFFLLSAFCFIGGCQVCDKNEYSRMIDMMESELNGTYRKLIRLEKDSSSLTGKFENGESEVASTGDWDNGFWAGNLWLMFELTGDEKWKERALRFTLPFQDEQWNGKSSLLGAEMMSSFGRAVRYVDDENYREMLVHSAKVLSSRFNPGIGAIGELATDSNLTGFSVNIETMLNINLLFWAAKETGNENFKKIALRHVETVLKNHLRNDKSFYEIVDYDLKTGSIKRKYNSRTGFKQRSWPLGQAVALYGSTAAYSETKIDKFLIQAEQIAWFILSQPQISFSGLHSCGSLSASNGLDCECSVEVIIASALYELSNYSVRADEYIKKADEIIKNISSEKFSDVSGDKSIKDSVFSFDSPSGAGDDFGPRSTALLSDYFFLECLLNKRALMR